MKLSQLDYPARNLAYYCFRFGCCSNKERVEIYTEDRGFRAIYVWLLGSVPFIETAELYQSIRSEFRNGFLGALDIDGVALLLAVESVDQRSIINFLKETKDLETISKIVEAIPGDSRTKALACLDDCTKQNSLALIDGRQIESGWTNTHGEFTATQYFFKNHVPLSAKKCSECHKIYKEGESVIKLLCEQHSRHSRCAESGDWLQYLHRNCQEYA